MFQQPRLFAIDMIHLVYLVAGPRQHIYRQMRRHRLDEYPDIILLTIFPPLLRIRIRFPITQITRYTLNNDLGAERYDFRQDV